MELKIKKFINRFEHQKKIRNDASRYLPIGPQTIEEQQINWDLVCKNVYEIIFGLESEFNDTGELFDKIRKSISSKRDTRDLVPLVDEVYLTDVNIRKISPFLNLLCDEKVGPRTKTMVSVFCSMLANFNPIDVGFTGTNFIENRINEIIKSQCKKSSKTPDGYTYLPFLADLLKKDLRTLTSNTKYLSENLVSLIELYSFLYVTQLSLHLGLSNSRFDTPKSQEVYFILETEKASKERHECNIKGYDRVFSSTNGFALNVFPYLGYLELITDAPIWKINELEGIKASQINDLNELICQHFDVQFSNRKDTITDAINEGLSYYKQLFIKTIKTSDRAGANDKVYKCFKEVFAQNFVSNRKAAGWYFQLTTKTVLLLTNLVIGSQDKLLIDDVIEGFKQRGIYLDLRSRSALLRMYEIIGNIEKLSDSGDAVYVKTTI